MSYDSQHLATNPCNTRYHTPLCGGVLAQHTPSYTLVAGRTGESLLPWVSENACSRQLVHRGGNTSPPLTTLLFTVMVTVVVGYWAGKTIAPLLGQRSLDMSTAANPPVQAASPSKGLLARHPLVFFFVIAYAGTWLVEMPYVLSEDGAGLLPYSSPLAQWMMPVIIFMGPFLAAFIMTGATEGREGVGRFLRRFGLWRVGLGWYLFVLIGIPAILVLSVIVLPGVLASFEGQGLASSGISLAPLPLLSLFVYVLFHGPLAEEPGWRGFALPRLQSLHGPLVGTLILGPLWALWHLPLFF